MNPLRYVNSWPTVATIAIVCATVFGALNVLEGESLTAVVSVLCVLGTVAAGALRAAFSVPPPAAPKRIKVPRKSDDDDTGEGGEVLAEEPRTVPQRTSSRRTTLLAVPTGLALALLVGCSPSALRTHATIATVATVAADVAARDLPVTCDAVLTACADDACTSRVSADCRAAGEAVEVSLLTVRAYVEAVGVAALADAGDVLAALDAALASLRTTWIAMGERLSTIGMQVAPLGGAQ